MTVAHCHKVSYNDGQILPNVNIPDGMKSRFLQGLNFLSVKIPFHLFFHVNISEAYFNFTIESSERQQTNPQTALNLERSGF